MKVIELLCKCYNCDYRRTVVTIRDNNGGRFQNVPNRIPDFVKNEHLTALEIRIEGSDKI